MNEIEAGLVDANAAELELPAPERGEADGSGDGASVEDGLGTVSGILVDREVGDDEAWSRQDAEFHGGEADGAAKSGGDQRGDAVLVAGDADERGKDQQGDEDENCRECQPESGVSPGPDLLV